MFFVLVKPVRLAGRDLEVELQQSAFKRRMGDFQAVKFTHDVRLFPSGRGQTA